MNDTNKSQSPSEWLKNEHLQILRRVDWTKKPHPRLNELLQQLHAAPDEPGDRVPIVEVAFAGEHFYLMPECVADFASRLYGAFRDRREPFTQETLDACFQHIGADADKIATVAALLYDDGEPEEPATSAEDAEEIE